MKYFCLGLTLLAALGATAKNKKKDKKNVFRKGDITVVAAYGSQKILGISGFDISRNVTAYSEYQLSPKFIVGLQYSYAYAKTKLFEANYQTSGIIFAGSPTYQFETWLKRNTVLANAEYCFLNRDRISLSSGLGFGVSLLKGREHIIDSVGISSYNTFPTRIFPALQLQVLNLKVRITDNWSAYGGICFGHRGLLSGGGMLYFQ